VLALLRTRRWLGFTALVIGAIVAFGLLSAWQWSRAEQHRQERLALQSAAESEATPIAAVDLGQGVATADEWRPVVLDGTYLPGAEVVVRKRPLNAQNGFWVMSAMETQDGRVVWVNRGWMPAGADALATPPVPAPPAGDVEVTGYLRAFEDADADRNDGLPAGQIAAPATALLPDVGAIDQAYVQLTSSVPAQESLIPLPLPDVDEGRNISYAVQWLLFAGVAMAGWFFFLQREAREDAMADSPADATPGALADAKEQ